MIQPVNDSLMNHTTVNDSLMNPLIFNRIHCLKLNHHEAKAFYPRFLTFTTHFALVFVVSVTFSKVQYCAVLYYAKSQRFFCAIVTVCESSYCFSH